MILTFLTIGEEEIISDPENEARIPEHLLHPSERLLFHSMTHWLRAAIRNTYDCDH